jgi:hypothetical protein
VLLGDLLDELVSPDDRGDLHILFPSSVDHPELQVALSWIRASQGWLALRAGILYNVSGCRIHSTSAATALLFSATAVNERRVAEGMFAVLHSRLARRLHLHHYPKQAP